MLVSQLSFQLARQPRGCHLITGEVRKALGSHLLWVSHGALHLFIRHTSASLSVNENADSNVRGERRDVAQRSRRPHCRAHGFLIALNGSSVDQGAEVADFKAAIKLFPARGLLSQYPSGSFGPGGEVSDPLMRVLYTPEVGSDRGTGVQVYYAQFLYTVTAQRLSSFPARVALYVGATHIGPVAAPLRLTVAEGSTATLVLPGTDPKGGPVTATVLSLPPSTSRGTLRQMGGQLLLTGSLVLDSQLRVSLTLPARGHGAEFTAFTYRVKDSEGLMSAPGLVVVDVAHVPLPPVALGGAVRGLRDLPVAVVLNGTSTEDGGVIRAILTSLPRREGAPVHGGVARAWGGDHRSRAAVAPGRGLFRPGQLARGLVRAAAARLQRGRRFRPPGAPGLIAFRRA
jgi:hypothetical protein